MLVIATDMVLSPAVSILNAHESEELWPALRSKIFEELPLVIVRPVRGVVATVTVELEPPVFENERARVVVWSIAVSVDAGEVVVLTVMNPAPFTVRVAFAVCVVTLSPLAETVIVYVPLEPPVMFQLLELLLPAFRVPMLWVVASLEVSPVGRVMLACAFETLSPLALTVAVRVTEPPTFMGSSELSEAERAPDANAPAARKTIEANTNNSFFCIIRLHPSVLYV